MEGRRGNVHPLDRRTGFPDPSGRLPTSDRRGRHRFRRPVSRDSRSGNFDPQGPWKGDRSSPRTRSGKRNSNPKAGSVGVSCRFRYLPGIEHSPDYTEPRNARPISGRPRFQWISLPRSQSTQKRKAAATARLWFPCQIHCPNREGGRKGGSGRTTRSFKRRASKTAHNPSRHWAQSRGLHHALRLRSA